jgi:hypothetical protein
MINPPTDDRARRPDRDARSPGSDGSAQPLERGYGDEQGGYLVDPTEDEPRRPAHHPDQPVAPDPDRPKQ